jgi:hypothetical protein
LATAVYNSEEIELLDGTTLVLRAMTIKNRRKFMKAFNSMAEIQQPEGDELDPTVAEDALLKLLPYCVAGQRPSWEGVWSEDDEAVEAAIDDITDALDYETVYYIIKQTSGIDLKAMDQMVMEAMMKDESLGTN